MRKFSRVTGIILILMLIWGMAAGVVWGETWEYDSTGQGKNPFTPRGYLVDTDKGQHWLSSVYNNSSTVVRYSGVPNGVDYLDAKKSDGSNYTFYAMTDRNPYPKSSDRIAYGKVFLVAWKNGAVISNFASYVQTPAVRADKVDPSGNGTCYAFKIENFSLEPGALYEFGFLRGMQANNGITLVLSEDEKGYIQQTDKGLTEKEKNRYNREKNREYEFVSSRSKVTDPKTGDYKYKINTVPMRFSVRTYADLSKWEAEADKAQKFLNSVTTSDLKNGKYKRSNIKNLKATLEELNKKAEDVVKLKLQKEANKMIAQMIEDLKDMLKKAQSEKPEPANISKLKAKLKEANALYKKAKVNVGSDIGQYGRIEVENLGEEIDRAEEMDQFTPQDEINDEVQALENAMTEVQFSKVQKEQRVFYDKVTGIYVIAPVDSLPGKAKLFVRRMGEETVEYKSMAKNLTEKQTEAVYYKIQFYSGDKKIQPTEKVEVDMPIVDSISQKSSTVYSVGAGGGLKQLDSVKANGTQVFKTKSLTALVQAGSTATDAEKAEARSQRMQALMAQKKDKDADNKTNQLEKDKKKKEEYKDPLNKILKRSENNATFSNDVRKETDPVYLIFVAIILAAAAVVLGIRGLKNKTHEPGLGLIAELRRWSGRKHREH